MTPQADTKIPGAEARKIVAKRVSAVVVTDQNDLSGWVNHQFVKSHAPGDADGGSATPISPDGYFLTADHVLARMAGRHVFVLYGRDGRLVPIKARAVWRSESADLALLHIPMQTPNYYVWSAPERWVPAGTPLIHGGMSTGFKKDWGKLGTAIPPESAMSGTRSFKIDIPFQPGDSGGPVVDAYGKLIGINSAVEFLVPMETAYFVDSEAKRPNTRMMTSRIEADRARNQR
ncbi:MAG: trypsin-like peptidase domain-containing protein [Gloeobacteraceae cyanobacterium ES-bin-144]|nr:trypsin-like peptidase domain-containing protein [Verrucomicrobiales bacterium]